MDWDSAADLMDWDSAADFVDLHSRFILRLL
jgi:hypothetical protein